ncbi:hypothetical protein ACA910_014921 [Epithemia clementina (nom. ined.)]
MGASSIINRRLSITLVVVASTAIRVSCFVGIVKVPVFPAQQRKAIARRPPSKSTTCVSPIIAKEDYWPLSAVPKLFSESVYELIDDCKIAVVPNFLNSQQVHLLRSDAQTLWNQHKFSTDALAGYGSQGKFDPTKDRAVLRLNQWKNTESGDWLVRKQFGERMQSIRTDLAYHLDRPNLNQGLATSSNIFGNGSTEISYTRFGPGAFLKRHVDEHHEELKGRDGWLKPTRRSISWLIYLNDADWNGARDGGQLRCFERSDPHSANLRLSRSSSGSSSKCRIGARSNGDLQIGWLRASWQDPVERPVFMDARRHDGKCALYILSTSEQRGEEDEEEEYISDKFSAQPILYMAGGETLTKTVLLATHRRGRELAVRFQFIESPKSMLTELSRQSYHGQGLAPQTGEVLQDVDPVGGTLVLFDSVTLPHEVLATKERERWATSGWMHEDQQPPIVVPSSSSSSSFVSTA